MLVIHIHDTQQQFGWDNVSVFELQSIRIIDCNLAVRLIESKYLKMSIAIWITEFLKLSKIDLINSVN
jgi:hypothetical protein